MCFLKILLLLDISIKRMQCQCLFWVSQGVDHLCGLLPDAQMLVGSVYHEGLNTTAGTATWVGYILDWIGGSIRDEKS